MIRAVILDFDDTLIKTKEMSFEKHTMVGTHFGYFLDKETFYTHYGKPWPLIIEKIFPGLAFSDFYKHLVELEKDYPFQEIEGAGHTLLQLRQQGIVLGILTSDLEESFFRRASRLNHLPYFDHHLIFCADTNPYTKPDGRSFLLALERLQQRGIVKEHIAFVGDLLTDYQAAKEAGVTFFAVTTGLKTEEDFVGAGLSPACILSSVAELPQKLMMYGDKS